MILALVHRIEQLEDENLKLLALDLNQFPEAILQEEMFKLEEKVIADKDKYFGDLIKTYKTLEHKEKLQAIQAKLKEEGADHEAIMKEISEHVKRGS